jgi:hypothetical protein
MWMPVVAGICNIVIGSIILIMLFLFGIGAAIIEPVYAGTFEFNLSLLLLVMPGTAIGALAIIGGVFAIRKERWGWALAGAIGAALVPIPLGIAAIVLLILSKNQFRQVYQ